MFNDPTCDYSARLYVGANNRLRFDTSTGVLTANCFQGLASCANCAACATEANCACYARCLHFEQLTNNTACPVYYFYADGNTYLCATGPAMVWITDPYGVSSSSPSIYKAGTSLMHNGERDPGLSYIKF